jgi:hypothetical protein
MGRGPNHLAARPPAVPVIWPTFARDNGQRFLMASIAEFPLAEEVDGKSWGPETVIRTSLATRGQSICAD